MRKYWADVQRGIVLSHGVKDPVALIGNPSRDGVSTKILVWRQFKPIPQLMRKLRLLNRRKLPA